MQTNSALLGIVQNQRNFRLDKGAKHLLIAMPLHYLIKKSVFSNSPSDCSRRMVWSEGEGMKTDTTQEVPTVIQRRDNDNTNSRYNSEDESIRIDDS